MLKYLRGQEETVCRTEVAGELIDEKGETIKEGVAVALEVTVGVVSTADQARLMDLRRRYLTIEGQIAYAAAMLERHITKVKLDGKDIDPIYLATMVDIEDIYSRDVIAIIGRLAHETISLKDEDVKK